MPVLWVSIWKDLSLIHGEKGSTCRRLYPINRIFEFFRACNEAAGGMIKLVTLAPNMEGSEEFIRELHNEVVISIGHTAADYGCAAEAMKEGALHVTHLYNAMNPMGHREPGVIGAAADNQDCMVELIGDGIHIHPVTVRNTFRLFGDSRVALISDSMMATGMENGLYELGGQEVTMKDRKATLADGTIAGSATCLFDCMKCVISYGWYRREKRFWQQQQIRREVLGL